MEILLFCIGLFIIGACQEQAPVIVEVQKKRKATKFYNTYAWKKARYEALRIQREVFGFPFNFCEDCGITGKHKDPYGMPIVMTVDHIECRSQNLDKALEQTNLRIACLSCNQAKGVGLGI